MTNKYNLICLTESLNDKSNFSQGPMNLDDDLSLNKIFIII